MPMTIAVRAICVGMPRDLSDEQGAWRSGIAKQAVSTPVWLGARGLEGDGVADHKHHGSTDQAVCCLPGMHHEHWGRVYARTFAPGAFGENWVFDGVSEDDVYIGDVYGVGEARVQVSQPRVPCWKQGRRLGLPGLEKAILAGLRTGFYLRVLLPGRVAPGDALHLLARPHPDFSVTRVNACLHRPGAGDQALAALAAMPELAPVWRERFQRQLHAD